MRLDDILQRQPVWRGASLAQGVPGTPSGFGPLDAALPGGGWPAGELTELLTDAKGIGELGLLAPVLRTLSSSGKRVIWIAPPHLPYAPALAASGIDLTRMVVLQPAYRKDALWAAEQALRAAGGPALLAWLPRLRYGELQRLAVAAEAGRGFAFLFRPAAAAREPSPAALRLALEGAGDELLVRIAKRRGAPAHAALRLALARPTDSTRHAVDRSAFSPASARDDRAGRRLGLPVHA